MLAFRLQFRHLIRSVSRFEGASRHSLTNLIFYLHLDGGLMAKNRDLSVLNLTAALEIDLRLVHEPEVGTIPVQFCRERHQRTLIQKHRPKQEQLRVEGPRVHRIVAGAKQWNAKRSGTLKREPIAVGALHTVKFTH